MTRSKGWLASSQAGRLAHREGCVLAYIGALEPVVELYMDSASPSDTLSSGRRSELIESRYIWHGLSELLADDSNSDEDAVSEHAEELSGGTVDSDDEAVQVREIDLRQAALHVSGMFSIMEWNGRYISIEEQCTYIFVANVLSGRQQVRPELGYSLFTLPPSSHPPFTFPAGTVEKCSPEILSLVFEHLVDYYAPEWDQPPTGHLYRWLPILWVCRYWRATAIATPRLFRYIDFLQLPDAAIVFFLRHSKGVDTSLWFNFDHSQDLQSALALKPGLLSHTSYVSFESAISPQERPHWLAATNLSRLYLRDRGVALIFDNPRISAFSRLRNRCVDSAIPGSMWHSGMFPDTLTELKIGLLQLPFYDDDTIPMDNARDDVSADHIISALASLSVLERLDLFIDPLSDSPPQQATRLPLHRLQSVNLFLPFIGYSHIMPFMPTSSYDLSVRFCQFMHRPEPDTYTISPFLDFVKRRHTYFRQVDIDVTSANIRITLHDTDGATMAVEANRDHDKILRDILEAVGPTYIKGVIIRDRVREEVPVDLTLRYRAILQVLRLLEHVTDLAIAGGLGPMARDLLVAVGGPPARLLFDTWDVPLLYWPDLQAIRLNSVRGDAVWGVVMGTTIGFIGLALMAINTPRQRVSVVRLADTAFTEQQVRPWTHWVPTIVVEGNGSEHDEVVGTGDQQDRGGQPLFIRRLQDSQSSAP